jgi:hypothetical protein
LAERTVSLWLAREFERTLVEVHERLVRSGAGDPLIGLRSILATTDHLARGADSDQIRQSSLLLGGEFERRSRPLESEDLAALRPGRGSRIPLMSLDELFEGAQAERAACEQEIGGRSL